MDSVKKFKVIVNSPKLQINGDVIAYKRDGSTYQLTRSSQYKLPEISYEVYVEGLLTQLGVANPVSKEDMMKHHLSPGRDGKLYLCSYAITDAVLEGTIRLWLTHQVLRKTFDLDIVNLDSFLTEESKKAGIPWNLTDSTEKVLKVCDAIIQVVEYGISI